MSERDPSADGGHAAVARRGAGWGASAPSRSPSADDGCDELRDALRTAFPQIPSREVAWIIDLARALNDTPRTREPDYERTARV